MFVARKQKKRAARWERHGRAQKSSERNRKRKKEKSDEAIQKSALESKVPLTDPHISLVIQVSKKNTENLPSSLIPQKLQNGTMPTFAQHNR